MNAIRTSTDNTGRTEEQDNLRMNIRVRGLQFAIVVKAPMHRNSAGSNQQLVTNVTNPVTSQKACFSKSSTNQSAQVQQQDQWVDWDTGNPQSEATPEFHLFTIAGELHTPITVPISVYISKSNAC